MAISAANSQPVDIDLCVVGDDETVPLFFLYHAAVYPYDHSRDVPSGLLQSIPDRHVFVPLYFFAAYFYHSVISTGPEPTCRSRYGYLPDTFTRTCNLTIELCGRNSQLKWRIWNKGAYFLFD